MNGGNQKWQHAGTQEMVSLCNCCFAAHWPGCVVLLSHSHLWCAFLFCVQRSPTWRNVWSPSMRPWSCCRRLTWRRCDTSWLTSRGLNSVTQHELQVDKDFSVQLKEAVFLFNPLHVTGWPRTRRRTWCPARIWVLCSVRRWWGLPIWTPWRR